jgi:phospholipase C
MSEYKCYVTIDNTHNPNNLVLVSSDPSGSYVTPPPGILPAGKTVQLELLAAWDEGPSDTLVWTSGVAPNQATITMTFADPFAEDNEATLSVSGSQAALLAYGVSYFYASAGDTMGGQPMQRDAVAGWGDPVRINYSVVQNAWANQPAKWSLKGIKRVVWYMLENRSLDHLLGQLYTENTPPPRHFYPQGSTLKFNGLGANPTFSNMHNGQTVTARPVPRGKDDTPNPDPFEVWEHVNVQIYPRWPSKSNPVMGGFLQDYFGQDSSNSAQIMRFYTPERTPTTEGVPVISYLARLGAVSDAWFCSAPTETYANRAFSISGTSDGLVDNVVSADPAFYANTIFNIMANCGFNGPKDWAIYANDTWPPLESDPELCFTTFQFQALYDLVGDNTSPQRVFNWDDLLAGAANGTLPAFCYVEPAWYIPYVGNGTDYHPPANLTPGEKALQDLFNALRRNPGWTDTLLIVTFDEHGGIFDHVPPYGSIPPHQDQAIPPDQMSAAPQNFDFKRMGVRVPTILISPHIQNFTVFRSDKSTPLDHTSLLKTILGWRGIDVSQGTAGARAAAAPDFSGVVLPSMAEEAEAKNQEAIDVASPVKPSDKQRPLSGLEQSMAGFWAYKITGGKRGNPEHLELTARIANAKTVAEMEEIVYAAVAVKRALGDPK